MLDVGLITGLNVVVEVKLGVIVELAVMVGVDVATTQAAERTSNARLA